MIYIIFSNFSEDVHFVIDNENNQNFVGINKYLELIGSTLAMVQSTPRSSNTSSSVKSFPLKDPDISSFNNLTNIIFNLCEEGKPFRYNSADGNEITQNQNYKLSKIVMIIKLSKVVTPEDNYGMNDYFLNNVVFFFCYL
jgi:hypothetical protein